jgi:hypothetical protein
MKLSPPFIITARLLPGLKVGDGFISITHDKWLFGRQVYQVYFDLPNGVEVYLNDLKSGVGGGDLQAGFESLLSFLLAAVESYRYHKLTWTDNPDDNMHLFPRPVVEWAYQNDSELQMLQLEIEEAETQLIEE